MIDPTSPRSPTSSATAEDRPNVVLAGFMGTGKTTVGRLLAQRLQAQFIDTDAEIERRHGPIPTIFAEDGEAAFRSFEREIAEEIAQRRGLVVATGGGFVVDPRNVEALAGSSHILCLVADTDEILRRVEADGAAAERPMLAGDDPGSRVRALLAQRHEAYARFEQVPTDGRTPAAIVDDIVGRLARSSETDQVPPSES